MSLPPPNHLAELERTRRAFNLRVMASLFLAGAAAFLITGGVLLTRGQALISPVMAICAFGALWFAGRGIMMLLKARNQTKSQQNKAQTKGMPDARG